MKTNKLPWLLWIIAAALLYLFENNAGTRLLLLASLIIPQLFCLPLIGAGKGGELDLSIPERAEKGSRLKGELGLSKMPFGHSFLRKKAVLSCEYLLTGSSKLLELPIESSTAAFDITLLHCGMVRLTAELWGRDAFGLFAPRRIGKAVSSVFSEPSLFTPGVELLEDTELPADGGTYSTLKPGNDPSETFGIREYMPGDPIRQIHWKLSQKTDKTMIREFGLPVSGRALIALDMACREKAQEGSALPEDEKAMDAMTELFFSVSRALLLSGTAHSLAWRHSLEERPRVFRVESDEDLWEAEREFFSSSPERELHLDLSELGESYAHGLLVCREFPDMEDSGFKGRLTAAFPRTVQPRGAAPGIWMLPFDADSFKSDIVNLEF